MRGGAAPLALRRPVPASAPEPGLSDPARGRGLAAKLRRGRAALLPRL